MAIAPTPQHVMHEPVFEQMSEPEMVSYAPDPPSPELLQALMQQASDNAFAGPFKPLDVYDVAEVNQILIDRGVEPMGDMNGVPLEESIKEIEDAIFLAQNAPFEIPEIMFDPQMGPMDPFGPGPMM